MQEIICGWIETRSLHRHIARQLSSIPIGWRVIPAIHILRRLQGKKTTLVLAASLEYFHRKSVAAITARGAGERPSSGCVLLPLGSAGNIMATENSGRGLSRKAGKPMARAACNPS